MKPMRLSKMSNRTEYFDVLRGLAIIGVVAIHSSESGLQLGDNSLNYHYTVLWRNLLNFSVPMFLAISGYFSSKKKIGHSDAYLTFLKKRIPRVYIPMFFWSVAWLCLAVLIQNKSIIHEIVKLVSFQSCFPYYFIALIIQYYILLPILNRLANTKGLVVCVAISIIMTGIIFYLRYYTDIRLPLIIYAGNFATWVMFFVLGLYLGSTAQIKISNKFLIVFILTFYILSCVESYTLIAMFHQAGNAVTAVKASSFLYSFALIVFLFKNHDLIRSKILKSVGEVSFGIYLIHVFPLMVASRLILRLLPSFQEFSPVYQFSLIGIVVMSCFLCISIFNSVFSTKSSRFIGFK